MRAHQILHPFLFWAEEKGQLEFAESVNLSAKNIFGQAEAICSQPYLWSFSQVTDILLLQMNTAPYTYRVLFEANIVV